MTSVFFRPEAEQDLSEAYAWYEDRRPGLGLAFLLSVEATLASMSRWPRAGRLVYRRRIRRRLIRRFPYLICYLMEEQGIVVLAVYHASRDPRGWKSRL